MYAQPQCFQKEIQVRNDTSATVFREKPEDVEVACIRSAIKLEQVDVDFYSNTFNGHFKWKAVARISRGNPQETIVPLNSPFLRQKRQLRIASTPKTGKLICMPSNVTAASKRNILAIHMHIRGTSHLIALCQLTTAHTTHRLLTGDLAGNSPPPLFSRRFGKRRKFVGSFAKSTPKFLGVHCIP